MTELSREYPKLPPEIAGQGLAMLLGLGEVGDDPNDQYTTLGNNKVRCTQYEHDSTTDRTTLHLRCGDGKGRKLMLTLTPDAITVHTKLLDLTPSHLRELDGASNLLKTPVEFPLTALTVIPTDEGGVTINLATATAYDPGLPRPDGGFHDTRLMIAICNSIDAILADVQRAMDRLSTYL